MSYYKLYRQPPDGKAVRGTLYLCDGNINRTVLVPAAQTLENAGCLIPALVYPVAVTLSPRFGKLLPLLCHVPGRSGIRIHGGVKPEHSRGCILLTRRNEYRNVVARLLWEQKQHEDIRIEIIEGRKPHDDGYTVVDYPKYQQYEKVPLSAGSGEHRV